jgi:adenylosuccinate lyase
VEDSADARLHALPAAQLTTVGKRATLWAQDLAIDWKSWNTASQICSSAA